MPRPAPKLHPLVGLLAAFIILVCLHSCATPLYEAPDEVWHDAYVRWLAAGNGLPAMDDNASGANQEVAQPPLYYAVAALLRAPFDDSDLDDLFWHNPRFGYQAPANALDNKNMLIHTARENFPWRGAALAIHITRLTSLGFGILTVIAAWGLGSEAFQTRRGALLTAALVAFQPQFVFMCGVVSNDSAAAALAALALWAAARMLRRGLTPQRALGLGALAGLGILAKTSLLALAGLLGAALLWQAWRERLAWRRWLPALALYGLAALSVGGWWYFRNLWLYGDLLGLSSHFNTPWQHPQTKTLLELLPELPLLVRSFWGAYGWGHIFWPDGVYGLLTFGSGLCLVEGAWRSLRDVQRRRALTPAQAIYLLSVLWLTGIGAALLYWMRQVGAPHGRLLFPALSAWALLLVYGSAASSAGSAASPAGRAATPLLRHLLLALAALSALAPGARLYPAFAPPRLRTPEQAARQVKPVNFDYDGVIRLLGVDIHPQRVAPGELLTVKACWEALAPLMENYTVYVQLLGQNQTRIGGYHTYPGLGRYPTSLWEPGRAFCDTYRLPVERWAPTPERYLVLVGLYAETPATQLSASTGEGTSLGLPVVTYITAAPQTPLKLPAENPVNYTLGEALSLRDYTTSGPLHSGAPFTLTLYWQAQTPPPQDYTVFVHLIAEDGALLAQDDGPPRGGWYPTSDWQRGEVVPDARRLDIPALPPGQTVRINVGMYAPTDLTRLPIADDDGRPLPDGSIPLFETIIQ